MKKSSRRRIRGVIILPGESLAKYRQVTAAPESSDEPARESEISLPEEEALEIEADEIELAEKVFAHHDDESVEDVEEKIEEVREDQPIPPSEENEAAPLSDSDIHAPASNEFPDAQAPEMEDFEGADIEDIPETEAEQLTRTAFSAKRFGEYFSERCLGRRWCSDRDGEATGWAIICNAHPGV